QVVVKLLTVFTVIAFAIGKAKKAFLQNRVPSVPESQGQTEALMIVAEAGDAIFTPTIGTTARLVMAEIIPGGSIGTIILANSSPFAFAQVGSPEPPRCSATVRLFKSFLFLHKRGGGYRFPVSKDPTYLVSLLTTYLAGTEDLASRIPDALSGNGQGPGPVRPS